MSENNQNLVEVEDCKTTDEHINPQHKIEYHYIVIDTYRETDERLRMFFNVSNLNEVIKYEYAPAFNINSFEYTGADGNRYTMEKIIGEIIEKVRIGEYL